MVNGGTESTRKRSVDDELRAGYGSLHAGDYEGANVSFNAVLSLDEKSSGARVGLLWAAHGTGEWLRALVLAADLLEEQPELVAAHLVKAIAFKELDQLDPAIDGFRDVLAHEKANQTAHRVLLDLLQGQADWKGALVAANDYLAACPDHLEAHIAVARAQYHLRHFAESVETLEEAKCKWPDAIEPLIERARIETWRWHHDDAVVLWEQALRVAPADLHILLEWCESSAATSQFQQAHDELDRRLSEADLSPDIRAKLLNAKAKVFLGSQEIESADACLDEALALSPLPATLRHVLSSMASTAMRVQDPERTAKVLERFEALDRSGMNLSIFETYSRCRLLIQLGRFGKARRFISKIRSIDEGNSLACELRSWDALSRGDVERARSLFALSRPQQYVAQLEAPIENLKLVRGAPEFPPGSIVAMCAVRDEILRIEGVLDHYRNLGVQHFVMIDNGSTDGTFELLQKQDDVVLLRTTDDYVRAGFGMRWINECIERYATDHWCLFIDADELLVFPECERLPLSTVTADMDEQGIEAITAFMLDMHPESPDDQRSSSEPCRTANELLATSPFFSNSYWEAAVTRSPYVSIRGGFRDKVGLRYRDQTKTPLLRTTSGARFLTSSHGITPAVVSPRRAALLHFKFMSDAFDRADSETEWTSHPNYTIRRDGLAEISQRETYMSPSTVRYLGSGQLEQLGLIW